MPTTPDDEIRQKINDLIFKALRQVRTVVKPAEGTTGIVGMNSAADFLRMDILELLADQRRQDAAAIKARVTDGKVPNDQYEASRRWRAAVDAVLLNDQGRSE